MDWIDKLNKELEERRERNKTSEAIEKAKERERKWISSQGGKNSTGHKKGGKAIANKNMKNGHWDYVRKLGVNKGGKTAGAIKSKLRDELYTKFLSELPDTFITSEARRICKKYNYTNWKGFLKCDKYVIQIHKGTNQSNPSIYKKVYK
jgi:hypothetical protein